MTVLLIVINYMYALLFKEQFVPTNVLQSGVCGSIIFKLVFLQAKAIDQFSAL